MLAGQISLQNGTNNDCSPQVIGLAPIWETNNPIPLASVFSLAISGVFPLDSRDIIRSCIFVIYAFYKPCLCQIQKGLDRK